MNYETVATKDQVEELVSKLGNLKAEVHKRIIGQDSVIDQLVVGLLAGGHVLLEGVPGLAKTLMIKTLAEALQLDFNRIQFTPDLMPTDILGTEILQEDSNGSRHFRFNPGPVFTQILLADEINRTPPKTQAALLEVMQEYTITYAGKKYPLPRPFFLLATQNPIEQSGTFPLPEAQVDRFLLFVSVDYPTALEEEQILEATTSSSEVALSTVLHAEEIITLQSLTKQVFIDQKLIKQVTALVRNSRPMDTASPLVKQYVDWGAGPRAGQALILASKAYALLNGRYSVTPEDIRYLLVPALSHRVVLNFRAVSERIQMKEVLNQLWDLSK